MWVDFQPNVAAGVEADVLTYIFNKPCYVRFDVLGVPERAWWIEYDGKMLGMSYASRQAAQDAACKMLYGG